MELEKWIEQYNIKDLAYADLQEYLEDYKEEEIDDYNELFQNMNVEKVRIIIHSISYVINEDWYEDDVYKYIQVKFELEYADERFAEYSVSYDLTGKYIEVTYYQFKLKHFNNTSYNQKTGELAPKDMKKLLQD